jgi:hypothetical protein
MHAGWFQIVNPTTGRWVPKARYDLLFAGWKACIVDQPQQPRVAFPQSLPLSVPAALPLAAPSPPPATGEAAVEPAAPAIGRAEVSRSLWAPVAVWCGLVLCIAVAYWTIDEHVRRRRLVLGAMRRFAERFVHEFERPLVREHLPDRPIESRVRFKPARSRLDVLLAPHAGRRYPNLTDHRHNVIYDVMRVQHVLRERAFVSSEPYARGRWVVVPFQLKAGL